MIFDRLHNRYGDLPWWPGEPPFEIIVGAILTQNTNWKNVERAIENLKQQDVLSPAELYNTEEAILAAWIRPSGYYRVKTARLKAFVHFLFVNYAGELDRMFSEEPRMLRKKLLGVQGIGEETADSILLYAGGKPIFVVDAYTRRILQRHELIGPEARYGDIQAFFMERLPSDVPLFNQYHALLVNAGKQFCRKKPLCDACPLKDLPTSP
jgi:endonuclease-3 related protein